MKTRCKHGMIEEYCSLCNHIRNHTQDHKSGSRGSTTCRRWGDPRPMMVRRDFGLPRGRRGHGLPQGI